MKKSPIQNTLVPDIATKLIILITLSNPTIFF